MQGIDLSGAARGNAARNKSGDEEHSGDDNKGSRVRGRYAEEETCHGMRERKGAGEAKHQAREYQSHTLTKHHEHNFSGARSDGHAYADLVGALAHRERHDAANTRGSNGQREQRE